MNGFVTGLNIGAIQERNSAKAAISEWKEFSNGLQQQILQIDQALLQERIDRAVNRCDVAGIMHALASLPPDIKNQVNDAIGKHYAEGFMLRASELKLNTNYAHDAVRVGFEARINSF